MTTAKTLQAMVCASMLTGLAGPAAAFAQKSAVLAPRLGPLAGVVAPYLTSHEISGAVILIANKDRIIDRETVGFADVAQHRSMKRDDLFWIASMTKAMTASAVMMLVDQGKVALDDPVEKYLPEFKGQSVSSASTPAPPATISEKTAEGLPKLEPTAHPITVREILCHTAGLAFSSKSEPGALDLLPLKSAVDSYAAEPLLFQPGAKYSYSNEGFNIAGRIIEVVSGMPYDTFLQKRLLGPLGMSDTTFWPTHKQLNRLAKSYESGSNSGALREVHIDQLTYPLSDRVRRFAIPAGGLFSTADDIARFCQMVLNNGIYHGQRYLSEASVRLITSKQTGNDVTKSYGFGWNIGDGIFEHSGAYKTDMKVDRKRGLIIVFLVQHANDWATEQRDRLMNSLEERASSAFANQIAAAR